MLSISIFEEYMFQGVLFLDKTAYDKYPKNIFTAKHVQHSFAFRKDIKDIHISLQIQKVYLLGFHIIHACLHEVEI